jgi:hypothetical protein
MPKTEIDYSNTIIYKITCKDLLINELYVGHTTNFVQRKHTHKNNCINEKLCNHNCKLYDIIRKNGGWCNWKMEIIGLYNCIDHNEAKKKEQENCVLLKPTLNSIELLPKPKLNNSRFFCKKCNFNCESSVLLELHNLTKKHKNISIVENTFLEIKNYDQQLSTKKSPKIPIKYSCENCYYITCNKKDYVKHLTTDKHKNHLKSTYINEKIPKILKITDLFKCDCGKLYKERSGLWRHKKICNVKKEETSDKELIMMLIKENSELKNMVLDVCQKIQPLNNTINSNNVNSHNKTFNLNVFLNEHCKDAMNITDFVDSLKLQLSDLVSVGKLGFINGISNIIIKNLNSLEETKRPIHCTDTKREVLYIKDEDKWEKDNETNNKIRKVIKKIVNKNARLLPEFKKEYPDCIKSASKYSDQYNKIIVESMGGSGDNDLEKEDKIIKNIAKEVTIDKKLY